LTYNQFAILSLTVAGEKLVSLLQIAESWQLTQPKMNDDNINLYRREGP